MTLLECSILTPIKTFVHGVLTVSWLSICFVCPDPWALFPYSPLHVMPCFPLVFHFYRPFRGISSCLCYTDHKKILILSTIIILYNTIHLNNLIWILDELNICHSKWKNKHHPLHFRTITYALPLYPRSDLKKQLKCIVQLINKWPINK